MDQNPGFVWIGRILHAQKTGDLAPLARYLREHICGNPNAVIRPMELARLVALFDRFRLAKKRGGQRTPIGKLSIEDYVEIAANNVRDRMRVAKERGEKLSRPAEIKRAASAWGRKGVTVDALTSHMDGQRGASQRRRRKKTRP